MTFYDLIEPKEEHKTSKETHLIGAFISNSRFNYISNCSIISNFTLQTQLSKSSLLIPLRYRFSVLYTQLRLQLQPAYLIHHQFLSKHVTAGVYEIFGHVECDLYVYQERARNYFLIYKYRVQARS